MRASLRNVNPSLLAVMAEGFFSRLSFGLITFALPLFAFRELGLGLTEIGLLLSLNLMVAIALKPVMGSLADRFGLKQSLTAAIGLRSLVSLLLSVATVPWQLFAIRGVHGVSIALRDPSVNALIAEQATKKAIASSFAWYQTAKSVAGSAGKFLAGVLLTLTAANFSLIFLLSFVLSFLPLLVVARYVRNPEIEVETQSPAALVGNGAAAAAAPFGPDGRASGQEEDARPPVVPFMGMGFFISGTAYMLTNLFPLFAVEYAGLSEAAVGTIYALSTLVALTAPGFGWLSDNVSRKLVLSVRSLANVVSSAIYLVAPNFAGMATGRTLDDMGKAAFRPAWGAVMAEVSGYDRRRRARTMGYMSSGEDAGEIAGPILAGFLWSTWGIPVLLAVRIALSVFTEFYTVVLTRSLRRPEGAKRGRAVSQQDDAELVRRAIEAYNHRDVEAIQRYVHEDAAAYTFVVLRAETPFRGPHGIAEWLGNEAELLEEVEVESLDLLEVNGRILGFGQVSLRGKGEGFPRTVEAAWVWETRDGKISYMGSYLDPKEALRAAGLEERGET